MEVDVRNVPISGLACGCSYTVLYDEKATHCMRCGGTVDDEPPKPFVQGGKPSKQTTYTPPTEGKEVFLPSVDEIVTPSSNKFSRIYADPIEITIPNGVCETVISGVAGEDIKAGEAITQRKSDGKWYRVGKGGGE